MTPADVLIPVIVLLAFIGYVVCLSRQFWVTLVLTVVLAIYIARSFRFVETHLIYWAAAVGLFLLANVVRRFLPAGHSPRERPGRAENGPNIVIDGTNVMYWDGEADLGTLRAVVDYLKGKGLQPFVFLDASSRHHLGDKSLDEKSFAAALGLARSSVMVCPARTEADGFILKFAREQGLPVVSNDRFGDRAQQAKGIKLIKGGIANGKPILNGL